MISMRIVSLVLGTTALVGTPLLSSCAETSAPPLPAAATAPEARAYQLGLGDKLRINVYGERDLSGEFRVGGDGSVSLPLIGDVKAAGLTARELEATLVARYGASILRNPSIMVEVYDFRPYVVLGEVERPGRFPAAEGTTLIDAIAGAGGFTYRAEKAVIFIRRAGDQTEYRVAPNAPVRVGPGDTIRVAERHF